MRLTSRSRATANRISTAHANTGGPSPPQRRAERRDPASHLDPGIALSTKASRIRNEPPPLLLPRPPVPRGGSELRLPRARHDVCSRDEQVSIRARLADGGD